MIDGYVVHDRITGAHLIYPTRSAPNNGIDVSKNIVLYQYPACRQGRVRCLWSLNGGEYYSHRSMLDDVMRNRNIRNYAPRTSSVLVNRPQYDGFILSRCPRVLNDVAI